MKKILYVEDDELFAKSVIYDFEYYCKGCFEIKHYIMGNDALKYLTNNTVDLVLLDLGLPDITGSNVLKQIKEKYDDLPVIIHTILTDKTEEELQLVDHRADDYITKASSNRVLITRINRILKNESASGGSSPLEINEKLQQILFQGKDLRLTPAEFSILRHLINNPNEIHKKTDFLKILYPKAKDLSHYDEPDDKGRKNNPINTHIKNIRQKIKKVDLSFEDIKTHTNSGYSLKM